MIISYLAFECVHLTRYLSGDTNDSASGAQTSVTGLEGVGVSSLAEVVGARVDDDGALGVLVFCLVSLSVHTLNLNLEKLTRGLERNWRCRDTAGENTYANDAVWADELDLIVGGGAGGVALGISAEVAEVTNVALLVGGGAVVLATGVDWRRKLA